MAGRSLAQDFRYACRVWRNSPGFTAAAVLSLALGIGANSAIFQLIDAVRLRPLPIPDPARLAQIRFRGGNRGLGISDSGDMLSYPLWDAMSRRQQAFSDVLAWSTDHFHVGEGGAARPVDGAFVSGSYFGGLGIHPEAGRLFVPADDQPKCAAAGVVLSDSFWQGEFGGDPSVLGRTLNVEGRRLPVIGIAPAGFTGVEPGRRLDLALPLCAAALLRDEYGSTVRTDIYWLRVMGRLRPGWTLGQASQNLQAIAPALIEATLPAGYSSPVLEAYRRLRLEAVPSAAGVSDLRAEYDTPLVLLWGITGLVLLIACANLCNLMLARASAQEREFAVRVALGASSGRLMRQSLCQSLLLALAGAAGSLIFARSLSAALVRFLNTAENPVALDLRLDWRLLLFAGIVGLAACLIFGLAPAWRASQMSPGLAMQAGSRGLTAGRQRFSLQRALVVLQISVSLVLLAGALLFVRSFRNLVTQDLGFRTTDLFQAELSTAPGVPTPRAAGKYQRALLGEIQTIPRIEAVSSTTSFLIDGGMWGLSVETDAVRDGARFIWVSPGYFQMLGTPILAGRDFDGRDTESAPKAAIVNQTFVRRFFPNGDALGRTFRTRPEPDYPAAQYRIVGIVKDAKHFDLRQPAPPISYGAATQYPPGGPWLNFYLRSRLPQPALTRALQRRLRGNYPELAVEVRSLRQEIGDSLTRERLLSMLSGLFGSLAGLLAAMGLYGLMAFLTARRSNEVGIRLALGAEPRRITAAFVKEAFWLLTSGVALGALGALAAGRTVASLLFSVQPNDPWIFGAAVALLGAAAALGSYLPARRASRVDPMIALRRD